LLIDAFPRWLNLIPMRDKTSLTIAKKLFQHVGDFGVPIELVSDRGPGFIGDAVEGFLRLIGTEHDLTMAYSKEENGMVERANKETLRHLRNIIFGHDWRHTMIEELR
jgi:transposase InsO family protein